MWSEKFKLNKQLLRSVTEAGFLTPKEMQARTLSRIAGGQDIIGIGPEGCGKTTTYILGVLGRLKYGFEEAPRALILVPDKDRVLEVMAQFELLNKNDSIRVVALYAAPAMEPQLNALADGADIVVATPDRARAIYLKLGLNLNKIIMFVVDDAELIVKQGLQLPVAELANSIIKCQHLVFTEVLHGRLEQMIAPFMQQPAIIELDDLGEPQAGIMEQHLYILPNFRTKLNLLSLLLANTNKYPKALVFVNTRLTAEKVFNSLKLDLKKAVAILNPIFFESAGFTNIDDFREQDEVRVLIVANELAGELDLAGLPCLIHLELPEEKETYILRMIMRDNTPIIALAFATDLELPQVKKIEQAIGQKLIVTELPDELVIAKENTVAKKITTTKATEPIKGEAFHEKKEANKKDFNYGAGTKAKMTNKRKH